MKWPSNQNLMKFAGLFGGFVGCSGLYMHSQMQKRFKQTIFVQESLGALRRHPPACYLLGEPIKDFNIHFHDEENNHTNDEEAIFKIPVKGPKGHGWYFIRAEPRGAKGSWVGVRCELEIEKTQMLEEEKYLDKRLVIFDCDKHGLMKIESDNRMKLPN